MHNRIFLLTLLIFCNFFTIGAFAQDPPLTCDYACYNGSCSGGTVGEETCFCTPTQVCDWKNGEVCVEIAQFRQCVDSSSHWANCGAPYLACAVDELCIDGNCVPACPAPNTYCGPNCVNPLSDNNNCGECGNTCAGGMACVGGSCECPPNQQFCNGECRDVLTDEDHCGGCGNACAGDSICSNGSCGCPVGEQLCGEECVDLTTSPDHCGDCGNSCLFFEQCVEGPGGSACDTVCPAGQTDCGGNCVDLDTDDSNCGACGVGCPVGRSCAFGQCLIECQPGQNVCDGECVNFDTDNRHCGACDVPCAAGQVCDGNGQCAVNCSPGKTECDGECVDLDTDALNCGSCGQECTEGQACDGSGQCEIFSECVPGLTFCGSGCTNLLNDSQNCGECGVTCASGERCNGTGSCERSCHAGLAICSNECRDLSTDEEHCGGCGVTCAADEYCENSLCKERRFLSYRAASAVYLPYWSLVESEAEITVHAHTAGAFDITFFDRVGDEVRQIQWELLEGETRTLDLRDPSVDLSVFGEGAAVITPVEVGALITAETSVYDLIKKRLVQFPHIPLIDGVWTRFGKEGHAPMGTLEADDLFLFCPGGDLKSRLLEAGALPGAPSASFSTSVLLKVTKEEGAVLIDSTESCTPVSKINLQERYIAEVGEVSNSEIRVAGNISVSTVLVPNPLTGQLVPEDSVFLGYQISYANPLKKKAKAKGRSYSGQYLFALE